MDILGDPEVTALRDLQYIFAVTSGSPNTNISPALPNFVRECGEGGVEMSDRGPQLLAPLPLLIQPLHNAICPSYFVQFLYHF